MNKGGQFFLFAAIVAVAALLGITASVNTVSSVNSENAVAGLANEISVETKNVLDYGVFSQNQDSELTKTFLKEYAKYVGSDKVVFLVGNADQIRAYYFTSDSGGVGLSTGSIPSTLIIQQSTQAKADITKDGNTVNVNIDGVNYPFELGVGELFYFVMIKDSRYERYVSISKG